MPDRLEKTHTKTPVICLSTGFQSWVLLNDDQLAGKEKVLCPKSSLPAVPMTIAGLTNAIPFLIRENRRLRDDILDLQCAVDPDSAGE